MKNYYEILEVNEKASKETISKVFKMQIKKNHPDLFQGDEKRKAEEKTMLLNEAYETLSNEIKREEYDRQISVNKEAEVSYLNEQLNLLKDKLAKKEMLLQYIGEEVDINSFIQKMDLDNMYNPNYIPYDNKENLGTNENIDHFRDLKQFGFKLCIFILIIICILFILGQILDKDILGELCIRLFGS